MRHLMLAVGLAVLAIVVVALWIDVGEVLVLETRDETGQVFETELWAVERDGALYIRGGRASRWVQRLRKRPGVTVRRDGRERAYDALPSHDPVVVAAVDAAMAEKYGFADRLFGHLFDRSARVAIRLEPRTAAAQTPPGPGSAEATP